MWRQSRCQLRKKKKKKTSTFKSGQVAVQRMGIFSCVSAESQSSLLWNSLMFSGGGVNRLSANLYEFQIADSPRLMGAAHFKWSNCHTVPTILSCFDVRFKGLQSCQRLSSDTSPAMNRAGSEAGLSTLCFSSTQDRTDILEPGGGGSQPPETASGGGFRGPVVPVSNTHTHTHTHTHTNKHSGLMEGEDGRRWMVRSGWYDGRAVRGDKRETDELPIYS